jgi:diguanylate cyclase (GGDEF)-like protein
VSSGNTIERSLIGRFLADECSPGVPIRAVLPRTVFQPEGALDAPRPGGDDATPIADELGQARQQIVALLEHQRVLEQRILELTRLASTDELTGLRNRRYFREDLESAIARARADGGELSLIMLDVDRFKLFNDTYGHQSGDRVLVIVASLLGARFVQPGVSMRLGGEEFVLLLPGTDEPESVRIAESVRLAVERFEWREGSITASLGVSTLGPDTADPVQLVEEADLALYHSKSLGRNRASHYRELTGNVAAGPGAVAPDGIAAGDPPRRRRFRDLPTRTPT